MEGWAEAVEVKRGKGGAGEGAAGGQIALDIT